MNSLILFRKKDANGAGAERLVDEWDSNYFGDSRNPVTMSGFVNFCLYAIHAPTQEQHESLEESL